MSLLASLITLKIVHSLCVLVLTLLRPTNVAIGPTADLVIENAVVSPDGFARSAVLSGGTFPGPVIRGNKGDRFKLKVINHLTDGTMLRSTSIHWHGIFQKQKSNWADGASFVTQCPITSNDSFLYDFHTTDQAGTFWYHSHFSTQYCDGLRGAFILYDPDDPHMHLYDVDDESTIITLADWYHVPARGVLIAPTAYTLINGKGRYPNGPAVPHAVVNVRRGKRYRFRLIAMACKPSVEFSIDGHTLTIIEADGENTTPLVVDSLQIYAGQRYSTVLTANQPVGNYWIRANPDAKRGVPGFDGGRNLAILRYVGAQTADPTTSQIPNFNPLKETNLHPLTDTAAPGQPLVGGADVALSLNLSFDDDTGYSINSVPYELPSVPILLQILSGAQSAQDLIPPGSIYALPPNKVIEINIPGLTMGGPHPFHLHGHSFSVVRSANSTTYNFANPVRRDTVNTGPEDSNVTIRFVTDNAGPWLLHCHVEWHLKRGMGIVLVTDFGRIPEKVPVPDAWNNLCPKYDSLTLDQL